MVQALMRKNQRLIWAAIAVVVVITFVFWGVATGPSSGGPAGSPGSLYGKPVKLDEFRKAWQAVALLYGPQLQRTEQSQLFQELETWKRLIFLRKLDAWKVQASDEELVSYIQSLPMFQTQGRFDRLKYAEYLERVLPSQGYKAADFERVMREQIRLAKLELIIGATTKVTPAEVRSLYDLTHEKVETSLVVFDAADYTNSVTITEAELTDFFDKNKEQFRIPERRRVRYVRFATAAYTNEVQVSDAEVRAMFDQNPDLFRDDKGQPRSFESVREELRRQMIEERAFQRASDLATELALETVKPDPQTKEPDFTKVDLAALARKFGLEPLETDFFEPREPVPGLAAGPAFNQAAFALTPEEPFSDAIGCQDGVYVLQLLQTKPSELPTLDAVRDRVVRRLTQHRALEAARAKGREAARLVKTAVLAALAGRPGQPDKAEVASLFAAECHKLGLKVLNPPPFSQSTWETMDVPEAETLMAMAFAMRTAEVSDFVETRRGGLFLLVKDRQPPTDADFERDRKDFEPRVLAQKRQTVFGEWAGREIEAANPPILARLRQMPQPVAAPAS